MRRTARAFVIGLALLLGPALSTARGQAAGGPVLPYRLQAYYAAPGYYGTTYGVASYGLRQTYTTFTSSFGPGYAYGYPPAAVLPGPWGTSLWSPGGTRDHFVWRSPYYGTFGIPSAPANVPLPPIGVYAPGFGPGVPPALYGW
jgi:hypothetical protein